MIVCVFVFVMLLLFFRSAVRLTQPQSIYDYDIKQWTSADGLSNNSVRA